MTAVVQPINLGVLAGARIPHPHLCKTGPAWEQTVRSNKPAFAAMWGGGFFVISNASDGGADEGSIDYSVDGRNYTKVTVPTGATFSVQQVVFGNGIFVANTSSTVVTAQAANPAGPWSAGVNNPNKTKSLTLGMWFGAGQFVICAGVEALIFTSPDASNQVSRAVPVIFNTGIYDDFTGLHLACDKDTNDIYSSPDLITWALRSATTFVGGTTKRLVTNGNGHIIAIDGTVQRNFVSCSHDGGLTWFDSTGLPAPAAFYCDLVYVARQGIWILTDNNGVTYVSADDGVSWTTTLSNLNFILGSNQNWWMASTPSGFIYVAVPVLFTPNDVAAVGIC